jgi:adenylate cyclase
LVREVSALATARGVEVFSTFCESHATDVPFRVVVRLLRTAAQISGLDDLSARARVRALIPDADPEDMLLLDDLLGIADPGVELPKIDPDARRRRLTALVNAASLARPAPAVYVVEDLHWIDEVSESMVADFVAVIPQTHSLVLISYRPEYRGAISGRLEPGARCAEHRPCAAERFGDRSVGLAAARAGPLGGRVGHHDRREGPR